MKSLTFLTTWSRALILALLLPAGMLAAQNSDSPEISRLLEEVKNHAALADNDAHTLEAYTRSDLAARTHVIRLDFIKGHVNDLIRDGNQLSSMRDQGSPWQQEAIDRIAGLLPEMANHLTTTINHLNENPKHTRMQPYRDLAVTNQTIIHKAHEIISDYVDYGAAKAKAEALEKQLRQPADSETGF